MMPTYLHVPTYLPTYLLWMKQCFRLVRGPLLYLQLEGQCRLRLLYRRIIWLNSTCHFRSQTESHDNGTDICDNYTEYNNPTSASAVNPSHRRIVKSAANPSIHSFIHLQRSTDTRVVESDGWVLIHRSIAPDKRKPLGCASIIIHLKSQNPPNAAMPSPRPAI